MTKGSDGPSKGPTSINPRPGGASLSSARDRFRVRPVHAGRLMYLLRL